MLRNLPVDDITVPERHRRPTADAIKGMAASILEVGLLQPVVVDQGSQLIAGATRLAAYKLLERDTIPCNVMGLDKLHGELAEIDENLERHVLTALDHVKATARRKEIYLLLHPETAQGTAGGLASADGRGTPPPEQGRTSAENALVQTPEAQGLSDDPFSDFPPVPSFAADTAKQTGQAVRTVQQDVQIGENLDDQAAEALRNTPTADKKSELKQLAALPAKKQRQVAKKLASGKAKTVAEATGAKPKAGQPKGGGGLFTEIEGMLGRAMNRADELNRRKPHPNLHKRFINDVRSAARLLADWRKATQ